jgi:hypothetical protein
MGSLRIVEPASWNGPPRIDDGIGINFQEIPRKAKRFAMSFDERPTRRICLEGGRYRRGKF